MLHNDFVQQSPPHSGSFCNYKNEPLDGDSIVTESGAINMKNVTHVEHVASRGEGAKRMRDFSGKT